jgi:hypothetical protein
MLKAIYSVRDCFEERLSKNIRFVKQGRKFVQDVLQRAENSVNFFRELATLSEIEDGLAKCSVFRQCETCCVRQTTALRLCGPLRRPVRHTLR